MFDKDAISQIRGSCDCDGEGGKEGVVYNENCENCGQKNRRWLSRSAFLWHSPPFSQTGWWSQLASFDAIKRLGLSSTPELFKLLNQAAWPSCSTDLAGRLVVWTRLYLTICLTLRLTLTTPYNLTLPYHTYYLTLPYLMSYLTLPYPYLMSYLTSHYGDM